MTPEIGASPRGEGGRFAPGNSVSHGRPAGSKNKLAQKVVEQIDDLLQQHGVEANVICTLIKFSMDTELKPELRIRASEAAARYLAPRLFEMAVSSDQPQDQMVAQLAAHDREFRAAAELLVQRMAEEAMRRRHVDAAVAQGLLADEPQKLLSAGEE